MKQDTTGCALKLLLVGNQLVGKSWCVTFEEDWASKYAEVSKTWFSVVAVLVGCCQELTMWMA